MNDLVNTIFAFSCSGIVIKLNAKFLECTKLDLIYVPNSDEIKNAVQMQLKMLVIGRLRTQAKGCSVVSGRSENNLRSDIYMNQCKRLKPPVVPI